jgi:glycosyltransferase involved in cell wall biosynthesis
MNNFKGKILILSNHHSYTYNFRKEIIQSLLDDGYEVHINLPYGEKVKLLENMGCIYSESPLDRRGVNLFTDFKLLKSYFKLFRKIRPVVVLSFTIKPNIYGGIISKILNIPFIPNVTGLGTALNNKNILQKVLLLLYKLAFNNASCIFFQNVSNKQFFENNGISFKKSRVLPGSGINTDEFSYLDYPEDDGIVRFLFIGRIMKDKGIEELIKAAKRIKDLNKNVQFDAIGFCEDEYKNKIEILNDKNIITFHGEKDNIQDYLKKCNAVIHPTYHEGMSNVLLEALSTGRPVLASNIPGCKEIFDEGISGFGFQPKNIESIIQVIDKFVKLSNEDRNIMGKAGRKKVESEFQRTIVVDAYLQEVRKNTEEN